MNIPRRRFLQLAAGAAALPAATRCATADTYPSRPVHLVVGFAAGSASDINARLVGPIAVGAARPTFHHR